MTEVGIKNQKAVGISAAAEQLYDIKKTVSRLLDLLFQQNYIILQCSYILIFHSFGFSGTTFLHVGLFKLSLFSFFH